MQDARCYTYMKNTEHTENTNRSRSERGPMVRLFTGIIPGCSVVGVTSGPKRNRHGVAVK
jgi:hypothetical protein